MNATKSVFLIEDDEYDQEIFTYILKSIAGVIIHDIADNGKEAIEKLGKAASLPDLIFTDIHMPKMDGIECLLALGKAPKLRQIPVIVLSSDISKINLMQTLGARAFIKKIGDIEKLTNLIRELVHLDYNKDIEIAVQTFKIMH